MYTRRLSQNFVASPYNLKHVPENLGRLPFLAYRGAGTLPDPISGDLSGKIKRFLRHRKFLMAIYKFSHSYPEKALKLWIRQLECVFAQRVRRGQQMICMYSKWWEEKAFKEFLRKLRVTINRNGKELLLGAVGVSAYNWEENRIRDAEFTEHLSDLDYIYNLKEQTMCLPCEEGHKSSRNVTLCRCGTGGVTTKSYDDWTPFIEKDDLIVWRRLRGDSLYEYKVYGSYYDVTAEDFLYVQVDSDYRKEWDATAVQLEIGERDVESNSDILYWEMLWPRLFVNRDYVFNRRYKIEPETNTIVIINKTTEYPSFPKYPDKYRVEDYWSYMVIKPYADMKKPGIEFSLTYFDNPGVNIPAAVTTWVAKSAMPDFLVKLREASKNYKSYCLRKGTSRACDAYRLEEKRKKEEEQRNKLEYCSNYRVQGEKAAEALRRWAEEHLFSKSK
ncbi:stAR-related lipid transfer protein 7, mitochondrial isoform X2 [Cylas formicarius]|uniref:stAR-related lipid transfer protein 7, mitochondrial isoform X2 n=1 Tax=Cylas formicarius TaxID=197179 RepID=UPI002958732E|nr:stAR-related lipid transfer protein 7, mitochondrial isoform X2 [Cylas formicarius]